MSTTVEWPRPPGRSRAGFADTRLDDVAAGVARVILHRHFDSKSELDRRARRFHHSME
jgi:hypothetical protein